MMKKQELQELNNNFFMSNIEKFDDLQLGFFNNNHILIIDEKSENLIFTNNENKEYESLCKQMNIGKFLNDLIGENWNHISFINIQKTKDDVIEESDVYFKNLTTSQIDLINPNLVICLGKKSGEYFGLSSCYEFKKINDIYYTMIPHPDTLLKESNYLEAISDICQRINKFFEKHAIVKVTNKKIYFRDIEFKKRFFTNKEDDSFCFIKTDKDSIYKSYNGYNLEKINKFNTNNELINYEKHLKKKDLFYYNNINDIQHSKMIRYFSFDIENDFGNDIINTDKIINCISFFDNLNSQYYTLVLNINNQQIISNYLDSKIKIFNSEKDMLIFFLELIKQFDILVGWYSNYFDIPYLINRAKKIGIDVGEYFEGLKIEIDKKDVIIKQDGYIFYDAAEFYKMNTYYNKPPSYSLDAVSKFLFGDEVGKIAHANETGDMWRNDINKLIEYNLHDVYLLNRIIDSNNIINYPLRLQQICPQDFDNVFYNSKTIENLLHHRYWPKKIYFPTKIQHQKREFEGAIVNKTIAGLHENVAVLDFSSMYTTVYLTFNYSDDTLVGEKKYVENNFIIVKNNLIERYPELKDKFNSFKDEECIKQLILIENDFGEYYFLPKSWRIGILPALEREMLLMRKYYKKERDKYDESNTKYKIYDELQGTAKTILNSIYGVGGFEKFILYNDVVASSITSTARKLNLWIQKQSKDNNYIPLYSDTDSCFISLGKQESFEKFVENTKLFENKCNLSFKEFISTLTSDDSTINTHDLKIEFEKAYLKLLLTEVKKRYFGFIKYYKGKIVDKAHLSVTGFETRRDDTPNFFKYHLGKCYELLLQDDYRDKIIEYYKMIKDEIKQCKVDDLIIKTKLSRDADTYTKSLPIHLRALQNSKSEIRRGNFINMIYVKDAREVLHYDKSLNLTFEIDYDKYIINFFINKMRLIDKNINFDNQQNLSKWF